MGSRTYLNVYILGNIGTLDFALTNSNVLYNKINDAKVASFVLLNLVLTSQTFLLLLFVYVYPVSL